MDATPTIVVGVDGTSSDAALEWAAAHAARTGARLHLLHCLEPSATPGAAEERQRAAAAELLARAAARADAAGAGPCTTASVSMPAGPALTAAGDVAALVVLGSRGGGARLGLPDVSVVGHVSRFARCPVAIVPDVARAATGVLELDLRAGDQITAAVRFALAYAAAHHLKICTSRPVPAQAARARRGGVGAGVATLNRDWEGADLVVLPAPGPGSAPWSARGHLTEIAARHAHCPVVFAR